MFEEVVEKYKSLWEGPKTVGDYIELLSSFPSDWPVSVSTSAGGGIGVEHRDVGGRATICIFGKNGGRFGENPLTEEEYKKVSKDFLEGIEEIYSPYKYATRRYTTIHGDHRLYSDYNGRNDTCYGTSYDERIIDRMVSEGLLEYFKQDYSRDGVRITEKGREYIKQQSTRDRANDE